MTTVLPQLTFEEYGEAIGNATAVVRNNVAAVGLAAPTPTRPGGTTRDLVIEQGRAHRRATAVLSGHDPGTAERLSLDAGGDLLGWLDDGMVGLLNVLARADQDLAVPSVPTTLDGTRDAWARRLAHDTTLTGVDAMTARLRRPPTPEELWFGPRLAVDGIDELLVGLLPQWAIRLTPADEFGVQATDADRTFVVRADGRGLAAGSPSALHDIASVVSGSAVEVYLTLWQRGNRATISGDPTTLKHVQQRFGTMSADRYARPHEQA